jgi:adenylate kinase
MSTPPFKHGRQYYLKNCEPDGSFNTWYFQFFVFSAFDCVFWAKYKKRMINLILFGPPGSGKGTQAAKLVAKYELLHISTGDLFRYEMGNNTPLGLEAKSYMDKGQLVPDEVTIGMLRNKVEANPFVEGYIFDGFPRTIPQADALDNLLAEEGNEVSVLLMLDVPDEELVKRLLGRGKESGRADDVDEGIIRNRIEVYQNETTPVFDYYAEKGKAVKVQGVGSVEEIFQRLCAQIDSL